MDGLRQPMRPAPAMPAARLFTHDAMNTTFSLHICGVDDSTATGMARECCEHLDLLETKLSRFIEGSDVARINHLRAGETLYLSEPCHQCLLLALDAHTRTNGLFDITLGTHINHQLAGDRAPPPPLAGRLTIHPDVPAITCEAPGRKIDLGGIGKGFALDQLMELLTVWGVPDVLLAAGGSSLLASGQQAWPVDLTGEQETTRLFLTNQALSASGIGIQGRHIIHPAGPDAMPICPSNRIWVLTQRAALAEIWSTALMLVTPSMIPDLIADNTDIASVYTDSNGRVERISA